jgi:hypothetical protein
VHASGSVLSLTELNTGDISAVSAHRSARPECRQDLQKQTLPCQTNCSHALGLPSRVIYLIDRQTKLKIVVVVCALAATA